MLEKKKNRLIKIYFVAVIILLIFLHLFKILTLPEKYLLSFFTDWQNKSISFATRLKYSFINFQEAQNLKKENTLLKGQLDQLMYENSQLNSYKSENEKLRALLNYLPGNEFDYLVVKIIGKDINRANTLLINKGSADGIKVGYPVIVDNGVIIGKIIEVQDHLAEVLLLTDKLSQLAISSLNSNKTSGLANGEYGLSIKIDLIPQDVEIKEGDIIITSGKEENIPRGLVIGKVNRVISAANELFKSATINPLVDYEELLIASVILPKKL
ncbi:MAG: rod shape-determining protein MreC [Candidatus Parcubacteria bacterium]|nr:rod shape-determining protein MreC [Candidatus Parcubacteria bacterium]